MVTWHCHWPSSSLMSTSWRLRLQSPGEEERLYLPGYIPTGWTIIIRVIIWGNVSPFRLSATYTPPLCCWRDKWGSQSLGQCVSWRCYQDNLNAVTHYLQVLWSHLTAAPKNSAQPTLDQVLEKYPITSPIFEFNKSMDRKYYYGRNSIILKSVGELIKDMIWLWPTSVGHILDIDLGRGVGENMRISQDVQWGAMSRVRGLLRGEFQKG